MAPSLRDIAAVADVSVATIDRVLHMRPGVQPHTRAHVLGVIAQMRGQVPKASDTARFDVLLPPADTLLMASCHA